MVRSVRGAIAGIADAFAQVDVDVADINAPKPPEAGGLAPSRRRQFRLVPNDPAIESSSDSAPGKAATRDASGIVSASINRHQLTIVSSQATATTDEQTA